MFEISKPSTNISKPFTLLQGHHYKFFLPYMSDHLSHIWWLKGTFNHSPFNFFFFGTSNLILIELITKLSIEKSSQLHKVNAVYIHEEGMWSYWTMWANTMSSHKIDKLSLYICTFPFLVANRLFKFSSQDYETNNLWHLWSLNPMK